MLDVRLPSPRSGVAAVNVGQWAVVLGGASDGELRDDILVLDLESGTLRRASAKLPQGTGGAAAAWSPPEGVVLLIGGHSGGTDAANVRDTVLRYDPKHDRVLPSAARLPTPRAFASAVVNETSAYVFGGYSRYPPFAFDDVLRYRVRDDAVEVAGRLPSPRYGASAAWDGRHAFVFGGTGPGGRLLDEIVRFDPATGESEVMRSRLPSPRAGSSAVWDHEGAFLVIGGWSEDGEIAEVVRYFPEGDRVEVTNLTLPTGRSATAAVYDAERRSALVIGGADDAGDLDEIVRVTPWRLKPEPIGYGHDEEPEAPRSPLRLALWGVGVLAAGALVAGGVRALRR